MEPYLTLVPDMDGFARRVVKDFTLTDEPNMARFNAVAREAFDAPTAENLTLLRLMAVYATGIADLALLEAACTAQGPTQTDTDADNCD